MRTWEYVLWNIKLPRLEADSCWSFPNVICEKSVTSVDLNLGTNINSNKEPETTNIAPEETKKNKEGISDAMTRTGTPINTTTRVKPIALLMYSLSANSVLTVDECKT